MLMFFVLTTSVFSIFSLNLKPHLSHMAMAFLPDANLLDTVRCHQYRLYAAQTAQPPSRGLHLRQAAMPHRTEP